MIFRGHGDNLNEFGEVNWTKSEMVPLSDQEVLDLMESHRCNISCDIEYES